MAMQKIIIVLGVFESYKSNIPEIFQFGVGSKVPKIWWDRISWDDPPRHRPGTPGTSDGRTSQGFSGFPQFVSRESDVTFNDCVMENGYIVI